MIHYKFCHGREAESGQFHMRLHILRSESRLAQFLMKENVNQKLELSHLTFFTFIVSNIKGMDPSSFFFNAIKDWNALPNSIKSINDHNTFKAAVKQHLKNVYLLMSLISILPLIIHLSDIHLKQPIGNKWKCFHGSSLEGYQLISAF